MFLTCTCFEFFNSNLYCFFLKEIHIKIANPSLERFAECSSAATIVGNFFGRNFKPHSHTMSDFANPYFDCN